MIEEYSTLYPATSSASASGKSKGARLVSANIETKKTKTQGNKGYKYQPLSFCAATNSAQWSDPANNITGNIVNPIDTSYEIICAAERNAPKNAYFELLAHPAMIIPYTLNEDSANKNSTPTSKSAIGAIASRGTTLWLPAVSFPKGMTVHPTKLNAKINRGAPKKSI